MQRSETAVLWLSVLKTHPIALVLSLALHACAVAAILRWGGIGSEVGPSTELGVSLVEAYDTPDSAPALPDLSRVPPAALMILPPTVQLMDVIPQEQVVSTVAEAQTITAVVQPEPIASSISEREPPHVKRNVTSRRQGSERSGSQGSGGARGSAEFIPPRYRECPAPPFPAGVRMPGVVLLTVVVDVDGRTDIIQVKRSSGSPALDSAAVNAVHRWRFEPARSGGIAVRATVEVPIRFRL